MNKAHSNPNHSLGFLTNRVGRLMGKNLREKCLSENYDITPHFMGILSDLWTKDGIKQQDLVISIIKDKATITRTLDAMEATDMLLRVPDKEDKRNKLIYLTNKGKQLKHQLSPIMQSITKEAVAGISKKELDICLNVLNKVYQNLKK